jgi:spermidine synthase
MTDDDIVPVEWAELDRRVEPDGRLLTLHRRGEQYEIRIDGRPVVQSGERSERALAELALAPLTGRDDLTVLLAGLGVGRILRALLDSPAVRRVDVIEGSAAIAEWAAGPLAGLNRDALQDPRVHLHQKELSLVLKAHQQTGQEGWLALILDLDEGPALLWHSGNAVYYTEAGIDRLTEALRPGGVLGLWSPAREPELARLLHCRLQNVAEVAVPVEVEGQNRLEYVYRGRRPAPSPNPGRAN